MASKREQEQGSRPTTKPGEGGSPRTSTDQRENPKKN